MAVYFIQAGDSGPVKIGVAQIVERRLANMQTGAPDKLRILAVEPTGDFDREAVLHEQFRDAHIHGEWFQPSVDLLAHIEGLPRYTKPTPDISQDRSALSRWLKINGLKRKDFAEKIGVSA